ncbi:MAG: GDSL-type esterase/lipase family protein [Corynebacterium sp.]|uniref:GDSL-type esterase/lipase family protein n=1 Tax=Corynebacterium sp. TaxID=1720 RepID=UPI0026DF1EDF|nr:GDSL-type esterase/lipase family protein [Corynebacterium sp.]MDO5668516.1 GDSL-type esterase/lipase family protein [Corynebacterium sp.]
MLNISVTARRLWVALASLVMLAGVISVAAPSAEAQQRNLVVFGDSIIADTPTPEYLVNRIGSGSSLSSLGGSSFEQCPTSQNNYGVRAGHKLGLPVWDYSCAGTTAISPGPQFSTQVDRALATGALTPATARVIVTTGFNDTYNNGNLAEHDVRARFVNAMRPQIDRIRHAAPNARIQIVGYATITENDHVCLVHVGGNIKDRTFAPQVGYWERLSQGMLSDLAHATGTQFVDMKPSTRDRGMCAPDHLRSWSGLIDFHAGPGNMPIHMTDRGHEHVANVIAAS